jgi:hypothetical protein
MPENDRGIGSEGLEQGGPNLGNDYTRSVGTRGNTDARDAIILPDEQQTGNRSADDTLNMDNESSRNLSGEMTGSDVRNYSGDLEDDTDDDDDEMMEDDVLQGLDTDDDDDEDEEENDII